MIAEITRKGMPLEASRPGQTVGPCIFEAIDPLHVST